MTDLVRLKCVVEGNRLRMRIISQGYNPEANCQCPRNIREAGREYVVPRSAITFSRGARRKFFYRIKGSEIKAILPNELGQPDYTNIKVYEIDNNEDNDCCICMDVEKDVVFAPCGHYCCCKQCALQIKFDCGAKCPICRGHIDEVVCRDDIST